MTGTLTTAARRVLLLAIDAHRDDPRHPRWLHGQLLRLDEPLRVAIAGKVKAGKSTLLNALVGEQVAPTDAGECTRVVTWYRDGPSPRILLQPKDGAADRAAGAPPGRGAGHRPRRHPGRAGGPADRGLAVAEPAGRHPDRHPGHRVDHRGELAAHGGVPRPGRRHPHRGRRGDLPDAPPARRGRAVPGVVPGPRGGPGRRGEHHRGASPGPTRSAAGGWTRCSPPAASPSATGPTRRCAGCARTWSRWPG